MERRVKHAPDPDIYPHLLQLLLVVQRPAYFLIQTSQLLRFFHLFPEVCSM
jgi:hypothetical protein